MALRIRIHFKHNDGTEDSVYLEGENEDSIREQAEEFFVVRGIDDPQPWSEEL